MIILIDQDDTIADYHGHVLKMWQTEYPKAACKAFAQHEHWETPQNYPEEDRARIHQITLRNGFFRNLPLLPGAKEGLELLIEAGHEVRIVTSPKIEHTPCVSEKYAWVEMHLGKEWLRRLMVTYDKTFVHGDLLIDDKPYLKGARTPTWEHVLFDRPYNQTATDRRRVTWLNFKEVLGL